MQENMASLIPNPFGSLQGVRILSTGSIIAQPFAAAMAAEMGAEVIQLERPGQGDALWRNIEFPSKRKTAPRLRPAGCKQGEIASMPL